MSAVSAARVARPLLPANPASEPQGAPRRGLRALETPRRQRRPRVLYGVIAVAGAVAIGAAQMGFSILTTEGGYHIADLNAQQRTLTYQTQILQDEIAGLSSPQYLAANATALGLVTSEAPNYVRLSDGAVTGSGSAAEAGSNINALGKAGVANSLVAGVPLATDPEASLDTGVSVDESLLMNLTTPPPIADGLPTPSTH